MSKGSPDSIWLRPEPKGRQPRLTRARIAAQALRIADAGGFEALSMRELASQLEVGTMTLYHYVRTKEDLVALMDDALMGELVLPASRLGRGWRQGLSAIAKRTREVFQQHPWALLSLRSAAPGPRAMQHFEQCLAVMEGSPFTDPQKLAVLESVDQFAFGSALRGVGAPRSDSDEDEREAVQQELGKRLISTGRFPHLARVFGGMDGPSRARILGAAAENTRFEAALKALLDGLVRTYAPRRRARSYVRTPRE